jgi:hypothetical protein
MERVFVGNLPWKTDPGQLLQWLRRFGVRGANVEFCRDKNSDLPLGFGFMDVEGGLDSILEKCEAVQVPADGQAYKRACIEIPEEFMNRRLRFSAADAKPVMRGRHAKSR